MNILLHKCISRRKICVRRYETDDDDDDDDAKDVYGRCDDGNGMITAYGNVYIIPVFKTILKFLLCPYGQMSLYFVWLVMGRHYDTDIVYR